MQSKKLFSSAAIILLTASLASCNIGKSEGPTQDVSSIFTEAAGTMLSQLNDQMTQTAQAAAALPSDTPTAEASFTPLPTFPIAGITPFGTSGTPFAFNTPIGGTPIATTGLIGSTANGCDDAAFLSETVPDKSVFAPDKVFEKTWSLTNTGTCTWGAGYSFDFISGDQMGGVNIVITKFDKATPPGHSNAFVVTLKSPKISAEYKGFWRMKNTAHNVFGSLVFVDIIVK